MHGGYTWNAMAPQKLSEAQAFSCSPTSRFAVSGLAKMHEKAKDFSLKDES